MGRNVSLGECQAVHYATCQALGYVGNASEAHNGPHQNSIALQLVDAEDRLPLPAPELADQLVPDPPSRHHDAAPWPVAAVSASTSL